MSFVFETIIGLLTWYLNYHYILNPDKFTKKDHNGTSTGNKPLKAVKQGKQTFKKDKCKDAQNWSSILYIFIAFDDFYGIKKHLSFNVVLIKLHALTIHKDAVSIDDYSQIRVWKLRCPNCHKGEEVQQRFQKL